MIMKVMIIIIIIIVIIIIIIIIKDGGRGLFDVETAFKTATIAQRRAMSKAGA